MARLHHIAADPEQLAHQLGWPPSHPPSTSDLLVALKHLGLKAKLSRTDVERLTLSPLPALALLKSDDGTQRVVVLAQCDGQRVLFQDPSGAIQGGRPTIEPLDVFASQWTGELILITSRASLAGELAKFDFSWFIPSIVKYRKLLGEVLVVSLFLQLFALVSPLFFQVVMDKVLVHRGLTTLDVLVTFTDSVTTSNDTYLWGIGSGLDTLTDAGGSLDHIDLYAGIAKSQLKFVKNANDLELSVLGQTDKLTIKNWYVGTANQIEEFRLSDGSKVLASEVNGLLSAMAAFVPMDSTISVAKTKFIDMPISNPQMPPQAWM